MRKVLPRIERVVDLRAVLALRLAVVFYRGRADIQLPVLTAKYQGAKFRLGIEAEWLGRNPLTVTALAEEIREWEKIGFELRIPGLDELELRPEPTPIV